MELLPLSAYRTAIHLDELFDKYKGSYKEGEKYKEIDEIFNYITQETGYKINFKASAENEEDSMIVIRSFLNERLPDPIDPKFLELLDHYLLDNITPNIKHITEIQTIDKIFPKSSIKNKGIISLWKGDITFIDADAIVNAANSQMLGCFCPMHKCIDNCIHTFASPRLRDDMNVIMKMQGFEEPTGTAKITRAYNLPSRFVLHTVGPIYPAQSHDESIKLLKKTYESCLNLANELGSIKSIAFCCISTGVFRFPNKLAASIAVETVDKWLTDHPNSFEKIIFNVFLDKDEVIYKDLLSK